MTIPVSRTAIVGVGETEFSRNSGRSELSLAAEASLAAITDAGLTTDDIDGIVTMTHDANDELELMRTLGIPGLNWLSRVPYGGGGHGGVVQQAAAAVAAGMAQAVLIFRAFNERSGRRFGTPESSAAFGGMGAKKFDVHYSVKLDTAMKGFALEALPYMRRYGVTSEDFGRYAVSTRDFAATNPRATFFGRPLTLEEHQNSRWIVEPILHLADCCLETDGGVAMVVTSLDRARDLPRPPVRVLAAAHRHENGRRIAYDFYRTEEEKAIEACALNDELFRQSGIRPHETDVAMLYDSSTPSVFRALEDRGFCGRGEAKDYVAAGHASRGGRKPVNPNGGLMGEGYLHGVNNIIEGVRQIRGEAANQVPGTETVLVSGGTGLILGR